MALFQGVLCPSAVGRSSLLPRAMATPREAAAAAVATAAVRPSGAADRACTRIRRWLRLVPTRCLEAGEGNSQRSAQVVLLLRDWCRAAGKTEAKEDMPRRKDFHTACQSRCMSAIDQLPIRRCSWQEGSPLLRHVLRNTWRRTDALATIQH
jgi:hypothetical protein